MIEQNKQPVVLNQSYQYVFTVFTPTYNRIHTLPRVYESLKVQTYRNFEWLIVDDGSTDNTLELVEQWQKENQFCIHYVWQENQGKHIAFNHGVQEAKGELFLTLDSDDSCIPEALERFKYHWDSIPENERYKFSAVTALCINQHGKLVGNAFPFDVFDSNSIEIHTKYRVVGEKWGFQRTDVLRKFPFPKFSSEKFISEGIIWNRISLNYKTRFVNEKLRIYYEEHIIDSLTNSLVKIRAKNPIGARLYYQEYINLPLPLMWRIKGIINYIRFSFHARINPLQLLIESDHKILIIMFLLVGYFFYKKDLMSA